MVRINQSAGAMIDETGDGAVENVSGTRGVEIKDANRNTLMRATSDESGANQIVFVPVDLSVEGETTEIDDVVTGQVTVQDAAGDVVFDLDAVSDPTLALLSGFVDIPDGLAIPDVQSEEELEGDANLAYIDGVLSQPSGE